MTDENATVLAASDEAPLAKISKAPSSALATVEEASLISEADLEQHKVITPGGWDDEFAGQGGQYVVDPATGNRVRVSGGPE